jgi:predicted phage tail protein
MTHIKLMGELGEKFGAEWTSADSSMRDVLKLIDCQVEGFKEYLADCHNKNVQFSIQNGDEIFEDEEDLWLPNLKDTVIITPVPAGSGKGLGKLIAGLLLLAALFFIPGLGLFTATGAVGTGGAITAAGTSALAAGGTVTLGTGAVTGLSMAQAAAAGLSVSLTVPGMLVAALGVNLALMGLSEMSAPEPEVDDPSFLFNGAGKNIEQGQPVPVLYGQMKIAGTPINEGFAPGTVNSYASSNYTTTTTSSNYKSDGTSAYTAQTAPHTGTTSSSDYETQEQ